MEALLGYYIIDNIVHKESCKKCKNALENNGAFTKYTELQTVIEANPKKACKCCLSEYKDYAEYYALKKNREEFYALLNTYAKHFGYNCNVNDNDDLEISTNIEKWIVHIESFFNAKGTVKAVLYHKNNLNFEYNSKARKCGDNIYPGYHIQFTKELAPTEIVNYVMQHEKGKWGAGVTATAKKPIFQRELNKI